MTEVAHGGRTCRHTAIDFSIGRGLTERTYVRASKGDPIMKRRAFDKMAELSSPYITNGARAIHKHKDAARRAVFAAALLAVATPAMAQHEGPFKQTNIHFETNATACDMGIQMSFDTNGITEGEIENPRGETVFSMRSIPGAEVTGDITEVFQERVEPPIAELVDALGCTPSGDSISLAELFANWPEGWYEFDGESQGEEFEGKARLNHRIPAGPRIITPRDGAIVPHDQHLRIQWNKVTKPLLPSLGPVAVVGYHVLVVDVTNPVLAPGKTKLSFDADVSAAENSFLVAQQHLEPKRIYELEVLATEKGGNQTITEGGVFCTAPIKAVDCVKP